MGNSARAKVALIIAGLSLTAPVESQTGTPVRVAPSSSNYLTSSAVPPNARGYLSVLGNRIQISGNERITLVGTVTDRSGTGPAQVVMELPGNVRLDRQLSSGGPLTFSATAGIVNAASVAQADLDILESLASDSHEAFLYGFGQKIGHRLLGTGFRTDDGKNPNYKGPYYDIYEAVGAVAAANNAVRQKWYFFDTGTMLLAKTRYLLKRSGAELTVETQFTNWVSQKGQALPGQIVRTENGTAVFTFKTAQSTVGPVLADGLFPVAH